MARAVGLVDFNYERLLQHSEFPDFDLNVPIELKNKDVYLKVIKKLLAVIRF